MNRHWKQSNVLIIFPAILLAWGAGTEAFAWEIDGKLDPPEEKIYLPFFLGGYQFEDNPGSYVGGGSTLALGIGVGYRKSNHLAFEFEGIMIQKSFDTPANPNSLFIDTRDELDLESNSLFVTVKAFYPMKRFEPYFGAGIGANISTLEIPAYLFGIIAGTVADESNFSFATQILLGADIVLNESWAMGIEYKKIGVNADFQDLSGGNIEIGGDLVALNLKYRPKW